MGQGLQARLFDFLSAIDAGSVVIAGMSMTYVVISRPGKMSVQCRLPVEFIVMLRLVDLVHYFPFQVSIIFSPVRPAM